MNKICIFSEQYLSMKKSIFYALVIFISTACVKNNTPVSLPPSRIAFGSCCVQLGDLSIFDSILKKQPDLYLALGDNMYGDALIGPPDSVWLAIQYGILGNNASFRRLKQAVPMIGIWDDHDYGGNNSGSTFPNKEDSKRLLLTFFNESSGSDRWNHPGAYNSYFFGDDAHKLQVIVLDTRWFLNVFSGEPISPTSDVTKNFLGSEQWTWLRQELLKPAKVRIVMTSTQMLHEHNGFESWTNYPHELNRFFDLLRETRAEGVFMVSGDVHWAELSKQQPTGLYPLYDMTSSGLNQVEDVPKPNRYRVGSATRDLNFGMINIDWNSTPFKISLEVYNKKGELKIQQVIPLDELSF